MNTLKGFNNRKIVGVDSCGCKTGDNVGEGNETVPPFLVVFFCCIGYLFGNILCKFI
jgi:hypothetical protein